MGTKRKGGPQLRKRDENPAYNKENKLVFDCKEFVELLDSHATAPSPGLEVETVDEATLRNGVRQPLVVRAPHKASLGLRMPSAELAPRDVARLTCPRSLVPVLDVRSQSSSQRVSLDEWAEHVRREGFFQRRNRGDAAAATRIVRGDESRRSRPRRG